MKNLNLFNILKNNEKKFISILKKNKQIDINIENQNGNHLLHETIKLGLFDAFKALLKRSELNINWLNGKGKTPLTYCANMINKRKKYFLLLIEDKKLINININFMDDEGLTALHYLIKHKKYKLIEILLKDKRIKLTNYINPYLFYAIKFSSYKIIKLILENVGQFNKNYRDIKYSAFVNFLFRFDNDLTQNTEIVITKKENSDIWIFEKKRQNEIFNEGIKLIERFIELGVDLNSITDNKYNIYLFVLKYLNSKLIKDYFFITKKKLFETYENNGYPLNYLPVRINHKYEIEHEGPIETNVIELEELEGISSSIDSRDPILNYLFDDIEFQSNIFNIIKNDNNLILNTGKFTDPLFHSIGNFSLNPLFFYLLEAKNKNILLKKMNIKIPDHRQITFKKKKPENISICRQLFKSQNLLFFKHVISLLEENEIYSFIEDLKFNMNIDYHIEAIGDDTNLRLQFLHCIRDFLKNPRDTIKEYRKIFLYHHRQPSRIQAVITLIENDYLKFKNIKQIENQNLNRFYKLVLKLPIEIQGLICLRAYNLNDDMIYSKQSFKAIQQIFDLFDSSKKENELFVF
jgi:hypothetical protein